ncbi:hypothetical protein SADUNF_Sadunf07G0013800 [Salix dunnii]|uniref:Transmembrane and coiled-coil domain-containing protein 4 n=1 Tax=Salix dunnii TaxID=1413687 RepID=A0A835K0Y4_9ROSI|nr:hypothetical protein SADUNF_Sadunf07G0013800 [Salix dunnii]
MSTTSSTTAKSFLSTTQRYAAGALFAIALHQAQIHQTRPLGLSYDDSVQEERTSCSSSNSNGSSSDSVSEDPELWIHENSGLLRPVFRFLEVESVAWTGLEETAGGSPAKHHVGAFMRLLSEENGDASSSSSQSSDQEVALSKAVDVMEETMGANPVSSQSKKEKHKEYETQCREKLSTGSEVKSTSEVENEPPQTAQERDCHSADVSDAPRDSGLKHDETPVEEEKMLSNHRKVTVLYEILSACLADRREENKKHTRKRNGYDARHRVALRLLATWLDIKWTKMEAIELMVACSAMAVAKEEASKEETKSPKNKWAKWKRGGIIGAAAITGGTLLAITGGLAAPAIAAGFGALAPTLGTIIPVIGASSKGTRPKVLDDCLVMNNTCLPVDIFVQSAAGAGLVGTKMARRTGSVDEFEFKAIGDNHNQGRLAVGIMVSGCVFDEGDFIKPWEGQNDNLEKYALQWESKNLIAVSTAIQDWLTSRIAMEFMRQGAMLTVLSTLLAALAWPATLLAATDFIDSKWTIAIDRCDKAGKLLAEVLLKGLQGNRPVTLVGYSLGARVIFKCLETLAETEHSAEVVERVVLLGAPISIRDQKWEAARKMVAGRFVNAYSTSDWTLGVAFRASLLTQGLAGIQPIDVPGIENVDVTDIVEGHSSYLWATQQILEQLELDAYYPVFRSPNPPERTD